MKIRKMSILLVILFFFPYLIFPLKQKMEKCLFISIWLIQKTVFFVSWLPKLNNWMNNMIHSPSSRCTLFIPYSSFLVCLAKQMKYINSISIEILKMVELPCKLHCLFDFLQWLFPFFTNTSAFTNWELCPIFKHDRDCSPCSLRYD